MQPKPTKGQIEFLNWEFGVFFHFGIRSFYKGHSDWDGIEMPLSGFDPDKLDCRQWISTAKEAGARYAILTTKHHDGFALWPTRYSTYSVAGTPWKDGKGDVVREFVDACRQYGLKVGLYYSPAQWGGDSPAFAESKEYDEYFINQISELLTNYGKIDYLWFDGCGSAGHAYDRKRIVAEIFRLQPDILTFCDPVWDPCVRWIGNEDGYASLDNPLTIASNDGKGDAFLPRECDCKIRSTWFYDDNAETIKPVEELFGMYESSVGHGSNFLLNVGPDDHGLLNGKDCERLLEFGKKVKDVYRAPNRYSDVKKEDGKFAVESLDADNTGLINRIVLKEDISNGQTVRSFRLYAHLPTYSEKILVYMGTAIGHKLICPIFAMRCPKIELEITDSYGEPGIESIQGYFAQ